MSTISAAEVPGILGVLVDRDAPAVVDDPAPAVFQKGDLDPVGVPGHGLVDGVVDHLVDEVVEAAGAGRADVHTRAFPDGFQALQDCDVLRRVSHARTFRSRGGGGGPRSGENAGQSPEIQRCHLIRRARRIGPEKGLRGPREHFFDRWSADRQRDRRADPEAVGNDHVAGPGGQNSSLVSRWSIQLPHGLGSPRLTNVTARLCRPEKVAAGRLHRGAGTGGAGRQFEDPGVEPLRGGRAAAADRAPVGQADAECGRAGRGRAS